LFNNATAGGTGKSKCFFGWDQKTNERSVAEIEVVEGDLGTEGGQNIYAGGGGPDNRRKIAPLIHPTGNEFNKNVDKKTKHVKTSDADGGLGGG
jgi:hypothetical protein